MDDVQAKLDKLKRDAEERMRQEAPPEAQQADESPTTPKPVLDTLEESDRPRAVLDESEPTSQREINLDARKERVRDQAKARTEARKQRLYGDDGAGLATDSVRGVPYRMEQQSGGGGRQDNRELLAMLRIVLEQQKVVLQKIDALASKSQQAVWGP